MCITIDDLVKWAKENDIPTDKPLAIRAKDDYMLALDDVYLDQPYFGNCRDGSHWQDENFPVDDDTGDRPEHTVIILDANTW